MKKHNLQSTYKSLDTEEWLDIYFTRPIGYVWAKFFDHFNIHPNVVTILSIVIGVSGGIMFYYDDLAHNIIGVLLFMWANFYDSADGQLARMTGKKTRCGRIMDGLASDIIFFTAYFCVCLRLYDKTIPFTSIRWEMWSFVLAALAGFASHARQCRLSDYYRNIHLFFLKGVQNELEQSEHIKQQRKETPKKGNFWWRAFLWGYCNYTNSQEKMTPRAQQLLKIVREKGIDDNFREHFRVQSLPLMKYTNMLTYNVRAIALYISCLCKVPWLWLLFECTVMNILLYYMWYKHEQMCKTLSQNIKK